MRSGFSKPFWNKAAVFILHMTLQKDIREFVALLLSENVEFLLVGGYALALHGVPRFTEDIDFLVLSSAENAARIMQVLDGFGFGGLDVSEADFQRPSFVIQLGMAPNRIDLLTGIDGVSWEEAWASREPVALDGLEVMMIGREALIRNKRASGRTQDLADVERLELGSTSRSHDL